MGRQLNSALIGALLLAVAGIGCNSYNPDLGATPFRCGAEEPRCPDGYICVERSTGDEVCDPENTIDLPDAAPILPPDARPLQCENDGEIEPNDSLTDPTVTDIPALSNSFRLVGLAICPDTDQDFFQFGVDTDGKNAIVELEHRSDRGELLLDILNATGVSRAQGFALDENPDVLRAEALNLGQGTYYAHIRAPAGVRNNYTIDIQITN